MPLSIRPVTPRDFEAIAALTNLYIRDTPIHFGYEPVTPRELHDAWFEKRTSHPYLVGEDDHGFVGYAKAGPWRDRAAYARTAEVGIYVEPRAHGKGIGTAMYRALIDACRTSGFHTLVAGLTIPNEASQRLHALVGFREVAVFREVGWKFGRWHDVAFCQLML